MANDNQLGPRRGNKKEQRGGINRLFIIIPVCVLLIVAGVLLFTNIGSGSSSRGRGTPSPSPTAMPSDTPMPSVSEAPTETAAAGYDSANWQTLLVNSSNSLPEGFDIELVVLKNEQAVDKRCLEDLQKMMDDCRDEGYKPLIVTSYRTNDKQKELYDAKVKRLVDEGKPQEDAEKEAVKSVAAPGTGEHQTGLAVDIVDEDDPTQDYEQEKTELNKWLRANCYKYGFILRYPADKVEVTGLPYEPYHFRYVGKDAAKVIFDKKITLEEYTELPEDEKKPAQPETTGEDTPTDSADPDKPSESPSESPSGEPDDSSPSPSAS